MARKILIWTFILLSLVPLTIGKAVWESWHFGPSQKILRFFREWNKLGNRLMDILENEKK